jgi:hypothetical protein
MADFVFVSEATGIRRRAASADKAEGGGGCREAQTLASKAAPVRLDERPSGGGKERVEAIEGGLVEVLATHRRGSTSTREESVFGSTEHWLRETRPRAQRDISSRFANREQLGKMDQMKPPT